MGRFHHNGPADTATGHRQQYCRLHRQPWRRYPIWSFNAVAGLLDCRRFHRSGRSHDPGSYPLRYGLDSTTTRCCHCSKSGWQGSMRSFRLLLQIHKYCGNTRGGYESANPDRDWPNRWHPRPPALAVNPKSGYLYVSSSSGSSVEVIDVATKQTIGTIPITANSIAFSPDGTTAYIAGAQNGVGGVAVVDTSTLAVTDFIAGAGGGGAESIAVTPDGLSSTWVVAREA